MEWIAKIFMSAGIVMAALAFIVKIVSIKRPELSEPADEMGNRALIALLISLAFFMFAL